MNTPSRLTRAIQPLRLSALALCLGGLVGCATDAPSQAQGVSERPQRLTQAPRSAVVEAAAAFVATLAPEQRATVQVPYSPEAAARWSNLPAGPNSRNGVRLGDLNETQVQAAMKLARLVLGERGFARLETVRGAEAVLRGSGRGGIYDAGNYYIALLGAPSATEPWTFQIGGHHLAFNVAFKGNASTATPYYLGIEPQTWTVDGKTHAPMAPMREAAIGLLGSLDAGQLEKAKLDKRFGDVYLGPGRDGQFPPSEGLLVSELPASKQALVKKVIAAWTDDSVAGAKYQKRYFSELDQTRVAYSGTPTFANQGDYLRIDGPHVWIEFICQNAVVVSGLHFHSVWRDRKSDYGASIDF